jgi:mono/diheme cytochrome c family protein
MLKRVAKWIGIIVAVVIVGGGAFAASQVMAFNSSMDKVYDVPLPKIERSTDAAVIERGKHLAESLGGCAITDCHGPSLAGGHVKEVGPLGSIGAPNITPAGVAKEYSDGELARLILHGLKRDGRSITFMNAQDFTWWPDEDVQGVISYVRSVAPVEGPGARPQLGALAKILDRRNIFVADVARRIDHEHRPSAPKPEPTAVYGAFVGKICLGCHGETLSGGPIPGAPPSLPVPLNLTPHDTGLHGWTYDDFDKLLTTGIRKNGKKIDPFMPVEALAKMNDTEKHALWAYLGSVPPKPFGGR